MKINKQKKIAITSLVGVLALTGGAFATFTSNYYLKKVNGKYSEIGIQAVTGGEIISLIEDNYLYLDQSTADFSGISLYKDPTFFYTGGEAFVNRTYEVSFDEDVAKYVSCLNPRGVWNDYKPIELNFEYAIDSEPQNATEYNKMKEVLDGKVITITINANSSLEK